MSGVFVVFIFYLLSAGLLQNLYACGLPPSFSQKERSHIHTLTRPGRRSIATSWLLVWSKVNIWREATVQSGSWGLWAAQICFSPSSLFLHLPPLHLYSFFIHGGGPHSPKGYRSPGFLLFDWASWDVLSLGTRSLKRLPHWPACLLWSG